MVTFDPNRPDFTPYGLTCVRWTPSPMRRPDHHNEIELNFLTAGHVTYLLGGRVVRISANELAVFWASIPHQITEFDPETRYFAATIPLAWFLQCRFPERFVQTLLRGEIISENVAPRVRQDFDLFAQWEGDLADADEDDRRLVMLEMEARLRRLLRSLPAVSTANLGRSVKSRNRNSPLHCGELNKVEQMACMIAQRYTEQLTVAEIGKCVGLHPNYAMGIFKKAFGTTLIDYLTRHRVSHAQRLLATTDEKIVEIALSSGFNSLSRFNEAFRRICGCTPRAYRIEHPYVSQN